MDTIVKALNGKVDDGNATTIVEALKQIDPNAVGETVAEVIENMKIGGGGAEANNFCIMTIDNQIQPTRADTDNDLYFDDVVNDSFFNNWLNDDNVILNSDTVSEIIVPYGISTYRCIPFMRYITETEIIPVITQLTSRAVYTISDLVNCESEKIGGVVDRITPIDATKPSSFKIVVTSRVNP